MRVKSAKASADEAKKAYQEDAWNVALDSVSINDHHWRCMVTMMVEASAEDSRYVSLFNEAATERKRARIYPLSYQKALVTVRAQSRQDPEGCPVIQGICHRASTVLRENDDDLSTWLAARVVKYLIYRAKIERVGRLRARADAERPTSSGDAPREANLGGTEYALSDEANLRGEDGACADDASFDEPSLHVVLSGFHDPDLPAELLSVGVPLTCILEIKPPAAQCGAPRAETRDLAAGKKRRFFGDYRASEDDLLEFWTLAQQRLADPLAYPAYSHVAVLTVCPPILPTTFSDAERESLKRDTYGEISLALRRLYSLCQQHASYLGSVRLERRILDIRERPVDTGIYEDALSDIPNECVDIPLILCAMLQQVESNLMDREWSSPMNRGTEPSDFDTLKAPRGPGCAVREKLKMLDSEYELCDEEDTDSTSRSSQSFGLEVIPHADALGAVARRCPNRKSLVDAAVRILRDPRITNIWREHEAPTKSRAEMYACHIDNIARALDRERVSREQVTHYLHLLMFDRLIFGNKRETDERLPRDEPPEPAAAQVSPRRVQSASSLTSITAISINSLRRCKSDSEIDYGKPVVALTDCPLLFALTDAREALLPGYLRGDVFKKRSGERASIDEYDDVELLSQRAFLQVAHECFRSFDRLTVRYLEPTDSILLYFGNNNEPGVACEEKHLSSIRTPVRLRDFCEYVAPEEENRMKREREARQSRATDPTERFMEKPVDVEDDDAIMFDDECFVLPNSLKARCLGGSDLDRDAPRKFPEMKESEEAIGEKNVGGEKMTGERRDERTPMTEDGNGRVMNGKTPTAGKKSNSKIDADASLLAIKKILSSPRCAEEGEPRDLVGYDLGDLRVQVSHHRKKFLLRDDISVRIELEDWLYGNRDLRVAVILRDCSLRLSGRSADMFHFTTRRGIVLGFCRNRAPVENAFDCDRRNLAFDFRASWPSGLLIEAAIEGNGTKNPFCIRQSYVAKRRPGRAGAAREVRRNFLRNGSVLKYVDDNTVVILRPNGIIVTCMDFEKQRGGPAVKTELRTRAGNPERFKRANTHTRRKKVADSVQADGSITGVQSTKQHVPSVEERSADNSLITDELATGKVLRYSIVNYDGRRYDVLNDLVVSEHDRLLVRTTSDYEVNEIFTRRGDGTDMLLRSNGDLTVTFADGTRITTGYTIEEQPVICEWSEDELRRYFGFTETNEYGNRSVGASSCSDDEFPRENPAVSRVDRREKSTGLSIADGFVSILLTLRMEHEDYATVSYDQSAVECTLSMAGDLRVSVSRRGHYEVSMGAEVNLKIHGDSMVLSQACATCGGRSASTCEFRESAEDDPRRILRTVDISGNVLEVKSDGSARYHRGDRRYAQKRQQQCCRCDDGDISERSGQGRSDEEEEEEENAEASCYRKHERYCEKLKFPARSQYRIFAMNRDLTACEYLHRSVRREQEVAAVLDDGTGMIQYPISRRPELRRLITFVPVEPELRSKEISCQVASGERRRYDRIGLLRSTYSFPYNWLFPFGKKDQVEVSERAQNEVSAQQNEQSLPKLLRVRVFFGIKAEDRSVLIDMQRAMGRYWISVFRDGDKCRLYRGDRAGEVENDYGSSEDNLRELAQGVKESIDVQTYVGSLRGKLIKVSAEAPRRSSRLAELRRRRGITKEEYEWYKRCMRERIIVPYFRNIAGSCYSLIKDLVDQATRTPKRRSDSQRRAKENGYEKKSSIDVY